VQGRRRAPGGMGPLLARGNAFIGGGEIKGQGTLGDGLFRGGIEIGRIERQASS
jgi:hypothetical protein